MNAHSSTEGTRAHTGTETPPAAAASAECASLAVGGVRIDHGGHSQTIAIVNCGKAEHEHTGKPSIEHGHGYLNMDTARK